MITVFWQPQSFSEKEMEPKKHKLRIFFPEGIINCIYKKPQSFVFFHISLIIKFNSMFSENKMIIF